MPLSKKWQAVINKAREKQADDGVWPDWPALANAPFPMGSSVLVKGSTVVWSVYDHHGGTWDLGVNTNKVVLVRSLEPHEQEHPSDDTTMLFTTWDKLEAAPKDKEAVQPNLIVAATAHVERKSNNQKISDEMETWISIHVGRTIKRQQGKIHFIVVGIIWSYGHSILVRRTDEQYLHDRIPWSVAQKMVLCDAGDGP